MIDPEFSVSRCERYGVESETTTRARYDLRFRGHGPCWTPGERPAWRSRELAGRCGASRHIERPHIGEAWTQL